MTGILQSLLGSISSAAAVVTDAYFNLVTLLLPGNGTNGAQNNTFLDSSSNNFTITRNGNTTQGTFSPFSQTGWSNYFDGDNDYLTTPSNAAFGFGTGDITVEFWYYHLSRANSNTIFGLDTSNLDIYINTSGILGFFNGTTTNNSSQTVPLNTWVHIAFVRSGTTAKMYYNGSEVLSVSNSINYATTFAYIGINKALNDDCNGYLSNLRVTKGGALYTGTFTPSTTPLTTTVSSGTVSLLTCQSNRFVDSSSNGFTLTPSGTPSVQAFSPFAPTAAYSAATVGGSGYFDGSGDYLTGNGILVTTTTANTFSCEGWFYPTTFANLIWLVGDMDATGGTNNVAVDISTGGAVELYWWDGTGRRCTSTSVMRLNQWNYFAVVVNAGTISIYVNSTTAGQSGTTTLTNRVAASQNFSVGAYNNSTTPNGYIGSLRWSTSARTISSIPTAPYTSDANTRLLVNFTNAGITDATAKNVLETVGNAQISTAQSKFGGGSMAFDGDTDYVGFLKNENVNLGSGNFTIEFWAYWNAFGTDKKYCLSVTNGTNYWQFNHDSSAGIGFNFNNGSGQTVVFSQGSNSGWSTGTWYHVALVRNGTTLTVYRNGTSVTSGTLTGSLTNHDAFCVGGSVGFPATTMNGYIDDFRLTKGYARYTTNFTAPTAAFALQ